MIRTQISLEEVEYRSAKEAAEIRGISLAELLRRSLRDELPVDSSKPYMRYCGFVESGKSVTGDEIDELVYGQKD
ncbi:MAG: hypothetical protein KDK41_17890 [Leptospiraceae bacterium]|nr:hypothetical protein [Leptospiraceae bacterium]